MHLVTIQCMVKKERLSPPLDSFVPLDQSLLWSLQEDTYQAFGPKSWSEKGVPYQVTSNPFIAKQYAQIALAMIEKHHFLSIVELGGGSGQFAFLFAHILASMVSKEHFHIYLTDGAESNVTFWRSHPLLLELEKKGLLSFAKYNPLKDEALPFPLQGASLFIGNYFFDSLPQAFYRTLSNDLYEGRVYVDIPDNTPLEERINKMHVEYAFMPAKNIKSLPHVYYESDLTFLWPKGAFQVIDALKAMYQGPIYLIAADKGTVNIEQIKHLSSPKIDQHGTFSFPVNFHAMQWYMESIGGSALLQTKPHLNFSVNLFHLNDVISPTIKRTFQQTIEPFDPYDMFQMLQAFDSNSKSSDFLLSLLKLSNFDPALYFLGIDSIDIATCEGIKKEATIACAKHFFPLTQESAMLYIKMGRILESLGETKKAEVLFEKSAQFGILPHLFDNSSLFAMQTFVDHIEPSGHILQIGIGSPLILAMVHSYPNLSSHTFIPLNSEEEQQGRLIDTLDIQFKDTLNNLDRFDKILIFGPRLNLSLQCPFPELQQSRYSQDDLNEFFSHIHAQTTLEPRFFLYFFYTLKNQNQISHHQYLAIRKRLVDDHILSEKVLKEFEITLENSIEDLIILCKNAFTRSSEALHVFDTLKQTSLHGIDSLSTKQSLLHPLQ